MSGEKQLTSKHQLEKELGIGHGKFNALVARGIAEPIYLPGLKRPKFSRTQVYRALGIEREEEACEQTGAARISAT